MSAIRDVATGVMSLLCLSQAQIILVAGGSNGLVVEEEEKRNDDSEEIVILSLVTSLWAVVVMASAILGCGLEWHPVASWARIRCGLKSYVGTIEGVLYKLGRIFRKTPANKAIVVAGN